MQSTTSNAPSANGSSSIGAITSACGFGTTSTPTYSRADAKKGRYGLTPHPTSRMRRPPARLPSSSSQRASGARTHQLGRSRDGSRLSRPGASRTICRRDREAEAEPRHRVERDPGDEADSGPDAHRDEDDPDRREREERPPQGGPHADPEPGAEDAEEQHEADRAEVR